MQRTNSMEKTLMLGKIEGGRRKGLQRTRWLDGIMNSMDMSLSKALGVGDGQGSLACCSPWGCKELDMTEWLNWTDFLEGLMVKMSPILWPPDAKSQLIGKDPYARKDWGRENGATEGIINSMHLSLSKLQEIVKDRRASVLQSMGLQRVGPSLATE